MDYKNVWIAIIASGEETRRSINHADRFKQFHQPKDNMFVRVAENFISLGVKPTQIITITTSDNQTELAKEQAFSRIYQISPDYDYAEIMIKAAEFIEDYDKNAIIVSALSGQCLVTKDDFAATIKEAIVKAKTNKPTIVGVKVDDIVTATDCEHAIIKPGKKAKNFGTDELMANLNKLKIAVCS